MVRRERRDDAVELGRRVRAHRKLLGLSQEAFGELVGVHRTEIGHIERGEKDLRLSTIRKVARAIGVDAGELIKGLPGPL